MAIQDSNSNESAPRSRRHRRAAKAGGDVDASPVMLSAVQLDVTTLPIALIDENPDNPRRVFRDIEGLSANILVHGVLQPLLVRPLEGKRTGRFEIVFGARRYRASKLAKLESLPCTVREYSDAEALELAIVENSQRSDVHPLEEADGYKKLREVHGYSVEEIAAKVGKSHAHVYQRLKYCSLVKEARDAFFDGKLTAATALLVARIPHEDLQRKALKELTDDLGYDGDPPGIREATRIVREKFMLRIVDANFDKEDATLVKGAVACSVCPKRTGNQRALFADLEDEDDLCTDPKCFSAKQDADWEKKKSAAKETGQKVLSQKESSKLFPYAGASLTHNSEYVDLSSKHYGETGKATTYKAIVTKAKVDVKPVLARDPDGKVHELVPRDIVNKLLPKGAKANQSLGRVANKQAAEAAKKERERAKRAKEKERAALEDLVAAAEVAQPNDLAWRALARANIRSALADARVEVCMRRGVEIPKGQRHEAEKLLLAHAAKLSGAEARGLVFELATHGRSYMSSQDASTKELLAALAPNETVSPKRDAAAVARAKRELREKSAKKKSGARS